MISALFFLFATHPLYAMEKVSLQLKWFHQFQFAGYYAAKEKGFYADAGLDVDIRPIDTKQHYIKQVISGDSEYGVADSILLKHFIDGAPVIALAAIFQHDPLVLLTRQDSEIISPYEMIGKRVMYNRALDDSALSAMFYNAQIKESEIQILPHSYQYDDLITNKTDAISAYITDQPYYFRQKNVPINIIKPASFGIDFYGDILFTTQNELTKHPERVKKMRAASLRGWAYALKHPQEIIDIILQKYPQKGFDKERLLYEAKETEKLILPDLIPLGKMTENRLYSTATIYQNLGYINKQYSLAPFIYDENRPAPTPSDTAPPAVKASEEITLLSEQIAQAAAAPLWNLMPDVLQNIVGSYFTNPQVVAIEIIDALVGKPSLSVIRQNGKLTHHKYTLLSSKYDLNAYKKISQPIRYKSQELGTVVLYYLANSSQLALSEKEKQFLRNHPIITVGIPGSGENKPKEGLERDLLQELSRISGFTFRYTSADNWSALLQKFKNAQMDVITNFSYRKERESYARFTDPYHSSPFVIWGRNNASPYLGPESLKKKHIGVLKDIFFAKALKKQQGVSITEFQTLDDMVKALAYGHIDLLIHTIANVYEATVKYDLRNIKILAEANLPEVPSNDMRLGVRKDSPALYSILQKSLDAIPESTLSKIKSRWLGSEQNYIQQKHPKIDTEKMDSLIEKISLASSMAVWDFDPDQLVAPMSIFLSAPRTLAIKIADQSSERPIFTIWKESGELDYLINENFPEELDIEGTLSISHVIRHQDNIIGEATLYYYPKTSQINPTQDERKWLRQHPIIRVSNELDWPPFDFAVAGTPQGYFIDLLNLLSERIGLQIQYVNGHSWSTLYQMFLDGELDLLHSVNHNDERQTQGIFSQPAYAYRTVFVSRDDKTAISDIRQLYGKVMAVGEGWALEAYVRENHPEIDLFITKNVEEMVEAVIQGKADAMAEVSPVIQYLIRTKHLLGLQISGWFREFDKGDSQKLYFMAHKSDPELISLLDKALQSLTPGELNEIEKRWMGTNASAVKKINLTREEQTYLQHKQKIKMCVLPSYMPYEGIDDKGNHVGVAEDLIRIMEKRIGTPIELHLTRTWAESLDAAKKGLCDILPAAQDLPYRREFMDFTKPYITPTTVIATRQEELFIESLDQIQDQKIGIIRKYAYVDMIKEAYPSIQIVLVDNIKEGLAKLRNGEIFGYVDALGSIGYILQKEGHFDIKIAGKIGFDLNLAVATRKDEPLLHSIFAKAIDSFTEEEIKTIYNKWISIKFEQGMDYTLIYRIALVTFIILLGFFFWNRKLRMEITKRRIIEMQLREAQQAALDASKAKSEFLANMSHEIRTPMNAIIGMSTLSLDKLDTDKEIARDFMKKSLNSAKMLLGIINDILDFSKVEAGKLEIDNVPMSLRQTVSQLNDLFSYTATNKGLQFIIEQDEKTPDYIMGDPLRLSQVLNNLISNAIKFTEEGSVTITIRLESREENYIKIYFAVKDTGKGISQERKDRLFQSFSQEDNSISREYGGTGLGLAISRKLVELMGGEIDFESEEGKGSTFFFTLPTELANMEAVKVHGLPTGVANAHLLIVDDDQLTLELFRQLLGELPLVLETVDSPEEALKIMRTRSRQYDLVFVDYKMPHMDGFALSHTIKKTYKADAPQMILISAEESKHIAAQMQDSEFKTFLHKPLDLSIVLDAIVSTLGQTAHLMEEDADIRSSSEETLPARILLVEDNEINQEVALNFLQEMVRDIDLAVNGQEAVDKTLAQEAGYYAAVLMDIHMPIMDGYTATRHIRSHSKFASLPIIAMTANALKSDVQKCIASGMNDHIPKPFEVQELQHKLFYWIRNNKEHQPLPPLETPDTTPTPANEESSLKEEAAQTALPLFDPEAPIKRLANKKELYIKLLNQFLEKRTGDLAQIQTLLDSGNMGEAAAIAHTFKGVSNTIGAFALGEKMSVLEKRLKEEDSDVDELMQESQALLSTLITQINTWIEAQN